MLCIKQQLMKIRSVTTVAEFKGDGREHAQNVKLEWTTDNGVLAEFDPQLRNAFYQRDDGKQEVSAEGQGELSLPRQDVEFTKLRIPFLQMPVKFKKEFAGYQIVYHCGASEQSNITLSDVELSDFSFDMKEGGTVLVVFNAYAKPNAADQGKIDQMMQVECEVSLIPPTEKQAELVPEKRGRGRPKKTAAEKVEQEGDPFEGSDLARGAENGPGADGEQPGEEDTEEAVAAEQAARDGGAWPFPAPSAQLAGGEIREAWSRLARRHSQRLCRVLPGARSPRRADLQMERNTDQGGRDFGAHGARASVRAQVR